MRKIAFTFILLIPALLWECTTQPSNPIEGVWDAQYMEWSTADTTMIFVKSETKGQMKIFTKEHFIWVNQNPENASSEYNISAGGAGTYKLMGDTLVETFTLSPWLSEIGKPVASKVEVRGDTLIQIFPYPGYETGVWEEWTGKEIYTRLE